MGFTKILSETTGDGVLVLTMNDPSTLNALGDPLMPELLFEIERFEQARERRALVIYRRGSCVLVRDERPRLRAQH